MRISLLTPTRGRPKNMDGVWGSAIETAHAPENLEIVFYLDEDDEVGIEKFNEMQTEHANVTGTIGPHQENGSDMWNEAYKKATGDILMLSSDDIVFRTRNWDSQIIARFMKPLDRIKYVWTNDGWKNYQYWGTHGFVHQNWVRAVGYYAPPLPFHGIDNWFTQTAQLINRTALVKGVLIEHMRWSFGKTDEHKALIKVRGDGTSTYQGKNSKGKGSHYNRRQFQRLMAHPKLGPKAAAEKLQQFIEESKRVTKNRESKNKCES